MTTIFRSPLVAAAAKQILRVANAATSEEAQRAMHAFRHVACTSDEHFEAAFLAAQVLRDLDRLDPEEAAHVFERLFDDSEQMGWRDTPSTYAFYRAHGETELATMMEKRKSTYEAYSMEGYLSLISGKPAGGDRPIIDTPSSVAHIAERTLAFSAAVTDADRVREWNNLVRATSLVTVEAAVSAVRRLREIGAVTPDECAGLIDTVIGNAVQRVVDGDRASQRLRHASAPEGHLTKVPSSASASRRAGAQRRLAARFRRIKAAYLRQLGEHELAHLLLWRPGEYNGRVTQRPFE